MKKREYTYDVCRALAIICVVLCHCTEAIYPYSITSWNCSSLIAKFFMTICFIFGRLGVPLFLFLTGALILKKNIEKDEDIVRFYKHNLIPLIIVNIIWIIIYNLYFVISKNTENISFDLLIRELLFIKQVPLPNMWYMPMIISAYLILPIIAKIIKTFDKKVLNILLIVSFISFFIIPFINLVLIIFKVNYQIEKSSYFKIFESPFIIYIIYGYYISVKKTDKKPAFYLLLSILFLMLAFMVQYTSFDYANYTYKVWYDSPLLFLSSYFLFKFIISLKEKLNNNNSNLITFLSKISLFVFFIHMVFIKIFIDLINLMKFKNSIKVLMLFSMVFILSNVSGYFLSKVKIFKEKILLYKD